MRLRPGRSRRAKKSARQKAWKKGELLPGLLAVLFIDVGLPEAGDQELNNSIIVERFVQENLLPPDIEKPFQDYLQFLRVPRLPQSAVEEILLDGMNAYLGLPDTIERADLLRIGNREKHNTWFTPRRNGTKYSGKSL